MATGAQGTVLYFAPQDGERVRIGMLSSVGELSPDSEEIDVTTLESEGGCREYMQGYRDSGELEVSGFFDAADAGQSALRAAYASGRGGSFEIALADGTKAVFGGFVKRYGIGAAEVDGAVGFTAVIRISGAVTIEDPEGTH